MPLPTTARSADALWRDGWYVDRQSPPPSPHCTVNAVHSGRIDEFAEALDVARAADSPAGTGAYTTVE